MRQPYDRVLIVCEGSKTEPMYFRGLVRRHRLGTANIEIAKTGAEPLAVVRKARQLLDRERRGGDAYDRVYCVFDRDEHGSFDRACDEARSGGLRTARSWPCFEFWLLLHFRYTRRPCSGTGGRTPARECIDELRAHWPGYDKAGEGVFEELADRLETAKARAARAAEDAGRTGQPNPSTEIHELVGYLQSLKKV